VRSLWLRQTPGKETCQGFCVFELCESIIEMSVHKLNTDRGAADPGTFAVGLNFQHELYSLADTVLKTRAIRALDSVAARYPIYREVRCAARRKLEEIFDDLALHSGLGAFRLEEASLLLDGPGVFIHAEGWRKADYSSCAFGIWTDSTARVQDLRDTLFRLVGERYARDRMFTLDWHFTDHRSGLSHTSFDELMIDTPHDEAYPTLGSPVRDFVNRFLSAGETVLVLQGAPGTGKTRLVRAILGAMSERKGDSAKVMYTADKRTLENDEIFVDFITGSHDAFVIEDADHMLLARSSGNHDLHRFLAIADGVVRAQGRKIIFTTNLPNMNDVDDALLRPGRCFASVHTRPLSRDEAALLLRRLVDDEAQHSALLAGIFQPGVKSASVADIYRACMPTDIHHGTR
jgi:hypothetical protein